MSSDVLRVLAPRMGRGDGGGQAVSVCYAGEVQCGGRGFGGEEGAEAPGFASVLCTYLFPFQVVSREDSISSATITFPLSPMRVARRPARRQKPLLS